MFPVFGNAPVAAVDVAMVMRVLDPLWNDKTETASRVRGRIERVLDWATARGHRSGAQANPARWRGHIENMLPRRSRVRRIVHHAALPYQEVAEFLEQLRGVNGIAAAALEFTILTAERAGETFGARWSEIDLAAATWTIPSERTKTATEHRVPLSAQAMAVLERVAGDREGYVFAGPHGRQMTPGAMLVVLNGIRPGVTVHGFRSSFRDWCGEQTSFSREVAERALGHTVGSAVEAAYARGDLFEKRRRLMDAWGSYCTTRRPAGHVVAIGR